jgi:hypothetical protein
MYADTNIVLLIFFSLYCNGLCLLPLILSIIGVATCTDEKARANAKLSLIISIVAVVLITIAQIIRMMTVGAGAFGGFK